MTARTKNSLLIAFSIAFAIGMLNALIICYDIFYSSPADNDIQKKKELAAKQGMYFDDRLPVEAIKELRKSGNDVWPHFPPSFSLNEKFYIGNKRFVPLSNFPNSKSIVCNESGKYPVYTSDSYGFNNDADYYDKREIDVALLGDSFAFGACVDSEYNIANKLRGYGLTCVNLGQCGNGPLMNLAVLSEYALELKAKYYVWLCYGGNDLEDAVRESKSEILMRYLENSGYKQGLKEHITELAALIKENLRAKMAEANQGKDFADYFFDILFLRSLRGRLGLSVFSDPPPSYREGAQLLERCLRVAKERVSKNGGRLIIAYLPSIHAFTGDTPQREFILNAIRQIDAPFLDMTKKFNEFDDQLAFFPFGMPGHYNENGYELVAESIHEFLQ